MTKMNISDLLGGSVMLLNSKPPKGRPETKAYAQRYVRDPEYWGVPYGTPITPGMVAARAMSARVPNTPVVRRISPRDKFEPLKKGPREYATDDASTMSNLPESIREELRDALVKEYGVTEEDMRANLEALYERATESGAVEAGMRWYEDGGNYAAAYALSYGMTREQGTAAVAALSPLREWEDNMALAQYVMDVVAEDPEIPDMTRDLTKSIIVDGKMKKVTRTTREWVDELFEQRGYGSVDDVIGKRMSEIDLDKQAALIRLLSQAGYYTQDGEKLSYMTVNKKGQPVRKFVGWPSGDVHTAKALEILRADPEDVPGTIDRSLQGMKVRSFYNNLSFGSTEPPPLRPDITMDTHAMSAAVGRTFPAKSRQKSVFFGGPPSSAEYGFRGFYPIFADAYRDIAKEKGIEPHHFQALIWLQWRNEQDGLPIIVHSALEGDK